MTKPRLDSQPVSRVNCAPWESRPDVQKLASAQRAKTTYPAREIIGDAIFIFRPNDHGYRNATDRTSPELPAAGWSNPSACVLARAGERSRSRNDVGLAASEKLRPWRV